MRKLKGIIINGEYLGNKVAYNGLFNAIYNISPAIIVEFIKQVSDYGARYSPLRITGFDLPDDYRIIIRFENKKYRGYADLSFIVENYHLKVVNTDVNVVSLKPDKKIKNDEELVEGIEEQGECFSNDNITDKINEIIDEKENDELFDELNDEKDSDEECFKNDRNECNEQIIDTQEVTAEDNSENVEQVEVNEQDEVNKQEVCSINEQDVINEQEAADKQEEVKEQEAVDRQEEAKEQVEAKEQEVCSINEQDENDEKLENSKDSSNSEQVKNDDSDDEEIDEIGILPCQMCPLMMLNRTGMCGLLGENFANGVYANGMVGENFANGVYANGMVGENFANGVYTNGMAGENFANGGYANGMAGENFTKTGYNENISSDNSKSSFKNGCMDDDSLGYEKEVQGLNINDIGYDELEQKSDDLDSQNVMPNLVNENSLDSFNVAINNAEENNNEENREKAEKGENVGVDEYLNALKVVAKIKKRRIRPFKMFQKGQRTEVKVLDKKSFLVGDVVYRWGDVFYVNG